MNNQIIKTILFSFVIILLQSCGGDTGKGQVTADKKVANSDKEAPTFTMNNSSEKGQATTTAKSNTQNKMAGDQKGANGGQFMSKNAGGSFSRTKSGSDTGGNFRKSNRKILEGVPDACSLISTDQLAKIMGVSADVITQRDASHTKSPYTRSCFYRWDGASPNTGILIQVQANPISEEYAEWVSLFVSSKRTSGETELGTGDNFKYEKLEGLGDDGSYSHRLGKYIWRDADKYVFSIAFNTNSAPEDQMKKAKAIGKIMMENYSNN